MTHKSQVKYLTDNLKEYCQEESYSYSKDFFTFLYRLSEIFDPYSGIPNSLIWLCFENLMLNYYVKERGKERELFSNEEFREDFTDLLDTFYDNLMDFVLECDLKGISLRRDK